MIPVFIETLVVGAPPSPSVIILRPTGEIGANGRVLPIWIGPTEAASIAMALQGASPERPMTHDLFSSFLEAAETKLDHIVINRVEGTTFYATVVLEQAEQCKNIDARPSDSIALAVREHAPIYVDEKVMNLASFPAALTPQSSTAVEVDEFNKFIDSVSPEDFKL